MAKQAMAALNDQALQKKNIYIIFYNGCETTELTIEATKHIHQGKTE